MTASQINGSSTSGVRLQGTTNGEYAASPIGLLANTDYYVNIILTPSPWLLRLQMQPLEH